MHLMASGTVRTLRGAMSSALTATGGHVEAPQNPALGAVYTPPLLASWVAERLLGALSDGATTVLDFACGEGELLRAVAARSPTATLIGSDVDSAALRTAAASLPNSRFVQVDAIEDSLGPPSELLNRLGLRTGELGGIVLNPPWGISLNASGSELGDRGYTLARGQYDSADIFLELAIKLLPPEGVAAFILPDSLFFPDHAPVRRFLLDGCSLELIARLGEGFFPGVFRGTSVIVLRNRPAPERHEIECLRLSQGQRQLVLAGESDLTRCAAESAHSVPQARFTRSASASFAIDIRKTDIAHVRAVHRHASSWGQTLNTGRGVELSKHGEVIVCPQCGRTRPRPRKSVAIRCDCEKLVDPAQAPSEKIVREIRARQPKGWQPLIAGEDVKRYTCNPSREIRTGIDGINYKAEIDRRLPRLLVRKTGIGLKAALYRGTALTTQTVFHFVATEETPDFLLPYALGVISSRIMLAVHLKRTGENEWRSHPYVTQKLLAELPIPHPTPDTREWRQARAIAAAVSRGRGRKPGVERDLEIERLIAGLYRLESADMAWVDQVLNEAQDLEGIVSLRLGQGLRLEPITVD